MATATKQLGLELFSNQLFRMEVEKQLGEEFVQACLDLAITICPPEPNKSPQKIKAHSTRFNHITKKNANQTHTIYPQRSGYGSPRNHKYEGAVGSNPSDSKPKRDRRRKKHLRKDHAPNTTAYLTEEQKQDLFLFQQQAIKQDKADKVARGYIAPTKKTMKHQSKDGYVPKETREVPVRIKRKRI